MKTMNCPWCAVAEARNETCGPCGGSGTLTPGFVEQLADDLDRIYANLLEAQSPSGEETEEELIEDSIERIQNLMESRRCRVCGCTDERACEVGCEWVGPNLCSACEEKKR
jgi:hypothetical protein